MPSPVSHQVTRTDSERAVLSVTVKRIAVFASVTLGDETESDEEPSSLTMAPVPAAVRIAAPEALLKLTTTVSCGSTVVSPVTDTVMSWLVVPAVNISVPPAIAV